MTTTVMPPGIHVLLVEDDRSISRLLQLELEHRGLTVKIVADGPSALPAIDEFAPQAIVLDVLLPGLDGERVLQQIRQRGIRTPVVMLTARDKPRDKVRSLDTGTDTGIGIPPDHLPYIFDRFYRADQSRPAGGAGLGLAIARQIAEQHAGTLDVTSIPGRGTTLTVRLLVGSITPPNSRSIDDQMTNERYSMEKTPRFRLGSTIMFDGDRDAEATNPSSQTPTMTLPEPGPPSYVTLTPTPLPPVEIRVVVPREGNWISQERNGSRGR